MRIVLQQKDRGLYLKNSDTWTRASSEAMDFVSSTAAIDFCHDHNLTDLQIVLKFDEQKYEIVLPALVTALAGERALPTHSGLRA